MALTAAKLKRAALRELTRRGQGVPHVYTLPDLNALNHKKQASLVESLVLGKARNVVVKAGRQSGKSYGAAEAAVLIGARVPGVNLIYVASTHMTCKKMAFLPAVTFNREHRCGGTPRYGQELAISFPNGSNVYFLGADSEKTVERLRGVPNLVMVIIDEASVYSPETLAEMIRVVRPGLRPRKGKLVVMGTGSRQGQQGTWYDLKQNPEYEQHQFDYRDNDRVPSFGELEATIDEDLRAQFPGMTPEAARETAWFKREYLGLDVVELAEMVYQITDANLVDELPDFDDGTWTFASAGDLGVSANDSIVSAAWRDDAREVYFVDQEEKSGQDSMACADMVNDHNQVRHPIFIALDPGGLGQKTIRTAQNLYPDCPVVEAVKPAVGLQVRAFNTLAQGGRAKLLRGSKLALELVGPTWVDGIVGGKIDEHGKHSDLTPPARYLAVKLLPLLPSVDEAQGPKKAEADREARVLAELERARRKGRRDMDREPAADGLGFEPGSPWG